LPENVIRHRFSSTKSSLRFAPSCQVKTTLFVFHNVHHYYRWSVISTVTTGSARRKLYMRNQFHRNTKCIYILHTQYFQLLKLHQYDHAVLPEAHNPYSHLDKLLRHAIYGANRNGRQHNRIVMILGHFSLHYPWAAVKPVAMTADINIFQLWTLFHHCTWVTILRWKRSSKKYGPLWTLKFCFMAYPFNTGKY